jgi:small subunit ribosomal protein S13
MTVYSGLTKIKGISWGISNAICRLLKINKNKTIGNLTESEIEDISKITKSQKLPLHLINRRNDFETGKDSHVIGSELDLKKELDIKRLKKIKSYRGIRHTSGLPLRGQRTKSHFRKNRRKGSGIKKK